MKTVTVCALMLFCCSTLATADDGKRGMSISFNSDDPYTRLAPRRNVHDARLAITTRDGSTTLLLLRDAVAVQLTDDTVADVKPKDDDSLLEDLVTSGVRVMLRKSVEYPIGHIRAIEIRGGVLTVINEKNQSVFTGIKINGTEVMRNFAPADAARFVSAFRTARGATGK